MNIGKRLALIREETGLNQIDFAKSMGVSQSSYKDYERGASMPPYSLLAELCVRFSKDANWLLLGTGENNAQQTLKKIEKSVKHVRNFVTNYPAKVSVEKESKLVALIFESLDSSKIDDEFAIYERLQRAM